MASLEALQRALARSLVAPPASLVGPHGQGPPCCTELQTAGHAAGACPAAHDCGDPILAGICQEELDRGRQTLRRKRLSQTRSIMPRTTTALAKRYARLFEAYAKDHHFSGYRGPLLDAVGFSRYLAEGSDVPPWVGELAAWEGLKSRWVLHPNIVVMLWLRYDVWDSATAITCQVKPNKRRSLWIAYRLFGRGAVRRVF